MDVYRVKLAGAHNDDPLFTTTDAGEAWRYLDQWQEDNPGAHLVVITRDETDRDVSIWTTAERPGH